MADKITRVRQQQRNTTTTTQRFSVGNPSYHDDTATELQPGELGINVNDGTVEIGISGDVQQIPSAKATDADDTKALVWNKTSKSWDFVSVAGAASGVFITFNPEDRDPDTANPPTPAVRNAQDVLEFDPDVDDSVIFSGTLLGYKGNGLTCTVVWCAKTATTGRTRWNFTIDRTEAGVTNIDTDTFAGGNSISGATTNATNGVITYSSAIFLDGAGMDNVAEGERFRVRLIRDADHGSDDMPGFAQMIQVIVTET